MESGQAREVIGESSQDTTNLSKVRSSDEIKNDAVMCETVDPGAAIASRKARILIYALLCLSVQCFMSYDGGATPASLDTIQAEMNNAWSEAEFGILGAIDKIGMTATSLVWGRVLQRCNAKLMLAIGLIVNAAATFLFGSLRNKILMYCTKFFLGATQSLQGVWATVWTVTMAPPEFLTMWLGLGGVSAGIGNGLGTAVAGFTTANGMPYSFAFQLQAGVLAALWVALVLMPPRWLRTSISGAEDEAAKTAESSESPRTKEQLSWLMQNAVFVNTALQISLIMFEVSGIQFLWVRFFVSTWNLDKSWITTMYLIVAGAGGGIGIALGPAYIDKMGGYQSAAAMTRSIRALEVFNLVAALFASVGIFCIVFRVWAKDGGTENAWGDRGDIWLWLLWVSLGVIHMAHQASVPALCGINIHMVPENMRTVASGAEMTVRNILGYAFGPLLPALFMSFLAWNWSWLENPTSAQTIKLLCWGMGFILAANFLGILILRRATWAASRTARVRQRSAMNQLQDAFKSQQRELLSKALLHAQAEELHTVPGGAAVIAASAGFLASGATGDDCDADFTRGTSNVHDALADAMTENEMRTRIQELERKVHPLEAENAKLVAENRKLREQLEGKQRSLPVEGLQSI